MKLNIKKICVLIILSLFIVNILSLQVKTNKQIINENQNFVSGEIILGFDNYLSVSEFEEGKKDNIFQKEVLNINEELNFVVLKVKKGLEDFFIKKYEKYPSVLYAEKNIIMYREDYIPNDPGWDRQWGPVDIKCPLAWNQGTGNKNVVVAIIDGGVDYNHPDLKNNMWSDSNGNHGYDFVRDDSNPMDPDGHGTHCAGIVAAEMNNNLGIAGVAQVEIMAIRVIDHDGSTAGSDSIADGIIYAANNGADVISMSFGCYVSSFTVRQACNYAWGEDVVLVASAGNDNCDWSHFPSGYNNVISVAATDQKNEKAEFSNWGSEVDVCAPGVEIISTYLDNEYAFISGTSMAAPHVAGVAALLKSQNPSWNNEQIRQKIFDTADKLGEEDNYWKYGKVDAEIDSDNSVFPKVIVTIDRITNIGEGLDSIDLDSDPEWFYEITLEHEEKEQITNFNFKNNPEVVETDFHKYFIEKYQSEVSSTNTWNINNGIHSFETYNPLVKIKIKVMEDDFIFDWFSDIADISSRNNPGGDYEIGYDHRGRDFIAKYDLVNDKIVDSESDRYEIFEDLYYTRGDWDGSTNMETLDWKQDDAQVFFKINDSYNSPQAISGGPYHSRVGQIIELNAVVKNGLSPYVFLWDLDDDGEYEKEGKNITSIFDEDGEYNISLKIIDSFSQKSIDDSKIIVIENQPPSKPLISGPTKSKPDKSCRYMVSSEDPEEDDIQYLVDWGDGEVSGWSDLNPSGESVSFNHSWAEQKDFVIKVKSKDSYGSESSWGELKISVPKTKISKDSWFFKDFLSRNPGLMELIKNFFNLLI